MENLHRNHFNMHKTKAYVKVEEYNVYMIVTRGRRTSPRKMDRRTGRTTLPQLCQSRKEIVFRQQVFGKPDRWLNVRTISKCSTSISMYGYCIELHRVIYFNEPFLQVFCVSNYRKQNSADCYGAFISLLSDRNLSCLKMLVNIPQFVGKGAR